jgi:hypothetical protein
MPAKQPPPTVRHGAGCPVDAAKIGKAALAICFAPLTTLILESGADNQHGCLGKKYARNGGGKDAQPEQDKQEE